MESTSDSLLEQLRSPGAEPAWNRFVELYSPLIFHWATRRQLAPQDAADLVQDVLAQLITQLPTFRYDPQQSFRAWLRTVVVNRTINLQRRSQLQPRTGRDADLQDIAVQDDDLFSQNEFNGQLAKRFLLLLRREFNERTWQAAWLLLVQGAKPQDVAARLDLTVNAVYVSKSRVLRRLRQSLEGLID